MTRATSVDQPTKQARIGGVPVAGLEPRRVGLSATTPLPAAATYVGLTAIALRRVAAVPWSADMELLGRILVRLTSGSANFAEPDRLQRPNTASGAPEASNHIVDER